MIEVLRFECEGCHQTFSADQLHEGKIGPHRWRSHEWAVVAWDPVGFFSASEKECITQMADWMQRYRAYVQEQEALRQEEMVAEQKIIEACAKDMQLRNILTTKNWVLAQGRVRQLAEECGIDWYRLTQDSMRWEEDLLVRCFAKAGCFVRKDYWQSPKLESAPLAGACDC